MRLINVIIDDKRLALGESLPGKIDAADALIELMKLYPKGTIFFIDDHTWASSLQWR